MRYGLPSWMSVKTTLAAEDGLGGSEKNRGTVITSLQLAFRRHDRNFTSFTIHSLRKSAGNEKHARHI